MNGDSMNCSDIKHLIHLDVGDDLRPEEEQVLSSHMERCSTCRAYHVEMSSAMGALTALRDVASSRTEEETPFRSVWPLISQEIRKRQTSPVKARKFNLQVAALSVCSLSLAVVTIVQSLSTMRGSLDATNYVPAQSVSQSGQLNLPVYPQYSAPRFSETQDAFFPTQERSNTSSPQSF